MFHTVTKKYRDMVFGMLTAVVLSVVMVLPWQWCMQVHASGLELLVTKEGHMQSSALALMRLCVPLYETDLQGVAEHKLSYAVTHMMDTAMWATDIALPDINTIAQRYFKRPEGAERRDINHDRFAVLDQDAVRACCSKLGLVDAVMPELKRHVDYVLLQGSTVSVMRNRIQALVHLVQEGKLVVSPDTHIIFLTGQRDLYVDEVAELAVDDQHVATEFEAAVLIWHETELPTPLRYSPVQFVNAPKRTRIDHHGVTHLSRPTTFDTLATWLKDNPAPGYCVSISSQPYVTYQTVTVQDALLKKGAKGFAVHGVGYAAPDDGQVGVLLDTFARIIYTVVHNPALLKY